MRKLATAVLLLFVSSLLSGAFATGCMAATRAPGRSVEVETLSCCAVKAACTGCHCLSSAHQFGCTSDAGVFAVPQKQPSANDLVRASAASITPAVFLKPVTDIGVRRLAATTSERAGVSSYRDFHARTGRLLI